MPLILLDARARPLLNQLPLPLAQLLLRALNAKSSVEHHHCAYYLLEASIKLAVAARIGLYLQVAQEDAPLLPQIARVADKASTGHWRGLLRDLDRALAENDAVAAHSLTIAVSSIAHRRLPALRRFAQVAGEHGALDPQLRKAAARPGIDGFLDAVVAYRNEILGHGAQRGDAYYDAVGPLLLAAALELLGTDALVGGLSLVVPGATVVAGHAVTTWTGLTGLAGLPIPSPDATNAETGQLQLAGGPRLIALHPLVVWSRRSGDPLGRVGFLNRTSRRSTDDGNVRVRRADYLDYTTGESLPDIDCTAELSAFLSRVGGKLTPDLPDDEGLHGPDPQEATDAAPMQRRHLVGDFELLEELGRGGMGVVWRARQLELGRVVALKVLLPEFAADPGAQDRFRREIQALGRGDHPNVVRVLSHGEDDGQLFYAMEYVDGTDLSRTSAILSGWRSCGVPLTGDSLGQIADAQKQPKRVIGGTPESLHKRFAALFAEVADGLQHLHDRGVLHRDLKPANLMLTANGERLVIADLGLARLDDATRALTASDVKILGTLRYMSPEQLQRNLLEVDGRADIYALGVTLTELCTGRPFFDGDTEQRLIHQVLNEDPPAPHVVDPGLPQDLGLVLQRATAKRADDRYPTAAAFAEDLSAFATDRPVSVRPPSVGRRISLFIRRNPVVAAYLKMALGVALVLVLFASSVFGLSDRLLGNRVRLYRGLETRFGATAGKAWMAERARMAWPFEHLVYSFDPADPVTRFEVSFDGGLPVRFVSRAPDGTPRYAEGYPPFLMQAFDSQGRVVQIRELAENESLVRRILVDWSEEDGFAVAEHIYQDGRGLPSTAESGAFVERIRYEENGVELRKTFFDRDRNPMTDRTGAFGVETRRDEQGRVLSTTQLDADGNSLWSVRILRQRGMPIVESYWGPDDRPIGDREGVHARIFGETDADPHTDPVLVEVRDKLGDLDVIEMAYLARSTAFLLPDNSLRPSCPFIRTYTMSSPGRQLEIIKACLDAAGRIADPLMPGEPAIVITRYPGGEPASTRFDASGAPK